MLDTTIPMPLLFDDAPLEAILYGSGLPIATSADVLDRWRAGGDLPPAELDAVIAILARAPDQISAPDRKRLEDLLDRMEQTVRAEAPQNPRTLLKIAHLSRAAQRMEAAEQAYRRALLPREWSTPLAPEERWQALHHLAAVLDHQGQAGEARQARALREAEQLLAGVRQGDLTTVRSIALDRVLAGDLATAERLYRGLLERQFQPPGTLVHLTRVLLLEQRIPEARQAVADAAKRLRQPSIAHETSPYIVVRVLYFRILLAMLAKKPYGWLVARLQRELHAHPERVEWTLAPVLKCLEGDLPQAESLLLERLADAINREQTSPP